MGVLFNEAIAELNRTFHLSLKENNYSYHCTNKNIQYLFYIPR